MELEISLVCHAIIMHCLTLLPRTNAAALSSDAQSYATLDKRPSLLSNLGTSMLAPEKQIQLPINSRGLERTCIDTQSAKLPQQLQNLLCLQMHTSCCKCSHLGEL